VALLLKVNLDGEGDSTFFAVIVGVLSALPIALPFVLRMYLAFFDLYLLTPAYKSRTQTAGEEKFSAAPARAPPQRAAAAAAARGHAQRRGDGWRAAH
jgi:hypothetical protein